MVDLNAILTELDADAAAASGHARAPDQLGAGNNASDDMRALAAQMGQALELLRRIPDNEEAHDQLMALREELMSAAPGDASKLVFLRFPEQLMKKIEQVRADEGARVCTGVEKFWGPCGARAWLCAFDVFDLTCCAWFWMRAAAACE